MHVDIPDRSNITVTIMHYVPIAELKTKLQKTVCIINEVLFAYFKAIMFLKIVNKTA